MLSRRHFATTLVASSAAPLAWGAKIEQWYKGVRFGVQSYSFRDRDLDQAIAAMKECGIGCVEMYSGHVEPKLKGEELSKWRTTVDLKEFKAVRKKYDSAGIELYAYNYSFRESFSDAEIERGFQMAKALGVKIITASSNVSTAKRISPYADKYKIRVGMHNHSNLRPNEFARPEDFAEAMKGTSDYICVNLDIGHFVAAGYDPVDYLSKHHEKIVTLHIKDRKRNQGPNTPFGQGDTPIKQVLEVLQKNKLKIPANIEYEYKGGDTVAEVKKCMEYMKAQLA